MKNKYINFIYAVCFLLSGFNGLSQNCNITWTASIDYLDLYCAQTSVSYTVPTEIKDNVNMIGVTWSENPTPVFSITDYVSQNQTLKNYSAFSIAKNADGKYFTTLYIGDYGNCNYSPYTSTRSLACNTKYYYTFFLILKDPTICTTNPIKQTIDNHTYILIPSPTQTFTTKKGDPIEGNEIISSYNYSSRCEDWIGFSPVTQKPNVGLKGGDYNFIYNWQVEYNHTPFINVPNSTFCSLYSIMDDYNILRNVGIIPTTATSMKDISAFKYTNGQPLEVCFQRIISSGCQTSTSTPVCVTYYPDEYTYQMFNPSYPFNTNLTYTSVAVTNTVTLNCNYTLDKSNTAASINTTATKTTASSTTTSKSNFLPVTLATTSVNNGNTNITIEPVTPTLPPSNTYMLSSTNYPTYTVTVSQDLNTISYTTSTITSLPSKTIIATSSDRWWYYNYQNTNVSTSTIVPNSTVTIASATSQTANITSTTSITPSTYSITSVQTLKGGGAIHTPTTTITWASVNGNKATCASTIISTAKTNTITLNVIPDIPKVLGMQVQDWNELNYDPLKSYQFYNNYIPACFTRQFPDNTFQNSYLPVDRSVPSTSTTVIVNTHSLIRASLYISCWSYSGWNSIFSDWFDTDILGTVTPIGTKVWANTDLAQTQFNDGTPITTFSGGTISDFINYGKPACYNTGSSYLYNGYVLTGGKNVCPVGWHVSTKKNWDEITRIAGGELTGADQIAAYPNLWSIDFTNTSALKPNNKTFFAAKPTGYIDGFYKSLYDLQSESAYWADDSEGKSSVSRISQYGILGKSKTIYINNQTKNYGFAIRCVQDSVSIWP